MGLGGADDHRCGDRRLRRARLGGLSERLRVRKAVSAAETFRDAGIPGQQGYVLQVIGGSAMHERQRPSMRGNCSWGSYLWVREGSRWWRCRVPPQPPWSPGRIDAGRIQPGKVFPGTLTLRPWKQGIVQGIVDELRELLGERLHVAVFDNVRRGMEIRTEHEGVSGGGVDAVRSPGAADRCVAIGVVGGVMRHGDDKLAFLLGKLLEELLLQKLDVDDGEGAAGLLRGEDVAVAGGDGDLDGLHLGLAEQRMPSVGLGEGGAQHGVGILCGAAGGEGELGEDGRAEDTRYVREPRP